jgi:phosphoribosylglycinamide formyltransferase-1
MPTPPINLAVLISGTGMTLQNFIDCIQNKSLNAKIAIVIASKPDIAGIDKALVAGLNTQIVERNRFPDSKQFSRRVFELCDDAHADLVCLAGWLCLLDLPQKWYGKAMNIHPALLPKYGGEGLYGLRVHQAVLDHGDKISGCTVHFIDSSYDTGPIILQRTCPVLPGDTANILGHRVFDEEKIAYPEAIRLYQAGRIHLDGRTVTIS